MSPRGSIPRRSFFAQCGYSLLTAGVWTSANAAARASFRPRLRIGAIGVGNRGETNVIDARDEQIVALCDVDRRYLEERGQRFPQARLYRDYRELLDRETLDAVIISSPDHTHAHAALLAIKRGFHVYCEKPLGATIVETRRMAAAAKRRSVVTQFGNQHHSTAGYQQAIDWIRGGVLGEVREVHSWTDRPIWPQGVSQRPPAQPVPEALDWNLWLGPAAERDYNEAYHPINWRGFWDFGTGALGDRGPHHLDVPFAALRLGLPAQVSATSSPVTTESAPEWSVVTFEFPARESLPPVRLVWHDGGKQPPAELAGVARLPRNGVLLIGDRAKLYVPELGGAPRLLTLPGRDPPKTPPPGPAVSTHLEDWLEACRTNGPTRCDFQYGAQLTELCLIGNLAIRTGQTIRWNAAEGRPEDSSAPQALLDRSRRTGWELPTLPD